jgi:hypothetical protein
VRLWRGLLGVDKRPVIGDIEFSQRAADGAELVWRGSATKRGFAPLWASYRC